MARNIAKPRTKKPVMVMLHGSGSSGAILGIQTHSLAKELSKTFDLVFIDAPTPSEPGPGILPLFANMPAYYRWLASEDKPASLRFAELFDVAYYIETQLACQNIEPSQVAAFLGFSQGALAALAMLAFRLIGQSAWKNLRFCVSLGAGTAGDTARMEGIRGMIGTLSATLGREDGKFPGYSVHASGLRDEWYDDGKQIMRMCVGEKTKTVDYAGGHALPRQRRDVIKLTQMIRNVDDASKVPERLTEKFRAPLQDARSSLLNGNWQLEDDNWKVEC